MLAKIKEQGEKLWDYFNEKVMNVLMSMYNIC